MIVAGIIGGLIRNSIMGSSMHWTNLKFTRTSSQPLKPGSMVKINRDLRKKWKRRTDLSESLVNKSLSTSFLNSK